MIKVKELKPNFYMYGNKGAVWNNAAHVAQTGVENVTTLCGTPMLATNWARIEQLEEIRCEKCIAEYNKRNEEV
jgi:hypothetical protein